MTISLSGSTIPPGLVAIVSDFLINLPPLIPLTTGSLVSPHLNSPSDHPSSTPASSSLSQQSMLELPPCQNLSLLDSRGPHPKSTPCPWAPLLSFLQLYIFTECSKALQSFPPVCSLLHPLLPLDQTLHNRSSVTSLHRLQQSCPLLCSSSKSQYSKIHAPQDCRGD